MSKKKLTEEEREKIYLITDDWSLKSALCISQNWYKWVLVALPTDVAKLKGIEIRYLREEEKWLK